MFITYNIIIINAILYISYKFVFLFLFLPVNLGMKILKLFDHRAGKKQLVAIKQ